MAIVEGILANGDSALTILRGVDLGIHVHAFGIPDHLHGAFNDDILSYLRQRRLSGQIKSAASGVRR
jgi:hypothetical protein